MFDFKAEYLFITSFYLSPNSPYKVGLDSLYQVTQGYNCKTGVQRKFNTESYTKYEGLGVLDYGVDSSPSPYGKIIGNTYYWYSYNAQSQFNLEGKEYTYVAF